MQLAHLFHLVASSNTVCPDNSGNCVTNLPTLGLTSGNLQSLLQIIFGALALVAVLVIIVWGGLRFVTAQGDPQEVAKARKTIIYALIGLAIAISGELIVSFILNRL